ncbi:hypothetical protein [Luteimonas saliphila]|uniref:hypothetical protein n=1 Tax=Luteimonas saliphila TaxID=2804919 RepID=UPI00192D2C84|nr:hypothetical protein [Luteimonas saliphila]
MYMILSRQNEFEFTVSAIYGDLEAARAHVATRIAECGSGADRLHPEALQIVQVIETAGGPG